jgi:hypothetical protein
LRARHRELYSYANDPARNEETMPDQQSDSFKAALLGSVRGRFVSALIVIILLLGIVELGISIVTGYYGMKRAAADAITAQTQADAVSQRMDNELCAAEKRYYLDLPRRTFLALSDNEKDAIHKKFCPND